MNSAVRTKANELSSLFGEPIGIISGLQGRPTRPDSQHPRGKAIDVNIEGWSEEKKKRLVITAIASGWNRSGIYLSDRMVHLDMGERQKKQGAKHWPMFEFTNGRMSQAPQWYKDAVAEGLQMLADGRMPGVRKTGEVARTLTNTDFLKFLQTKHPDLYAEALDIAELSSEQIDISGQYSDLRTSKALEQESIEWHLGQVSRRLKAGGKRLNNGTIYLGGQLGPEWVMRVLDAPDDSFINKLGIPKFRLEANKELFFRPDGKPRTVSEVKQLAATLTGQTGIELAREGDPRWAMVDSSTRRNIHDDESRRAQARQTEIDTRRNQERAAQREALYIQLGKGIAGPSAIQSAAEAGLFQTFDQYTKAFRALKGFDGEQGLLY